jgi:hypothetical protein
LQKHRQHNDTKAILIHLAAALATAKETPKIAFAPKFDLFEYHLNQSSSDQFDFAQKTEHLQVLSDNRIYILHRIQNSFSEICFSTITKLYSFMLAS